MRIHNLFRNISFRWTLYHTLISFDFIGSSCTFNSLIKNSWTHICINITLYRFLTINLANKTLHAFLHRLRYLRRHFRYNIHYFLLSLLCFIVCFYYIINVEVLLRVIKILILVLLDLLLLNHVFHVELLSLHCKRRWLSICICRWY